MDPFERAAAALANSAFGRDATYSMKEGGPSFPVRVILSQPEDTAGGFGALAKSSVVVQATITAAAFGPGRPSRGDLLAVGFEKGWRVEKIQQDLEAVSYVLGLVRQD